MEKSQLVKKAYQAIHAALKCLENNKDWHTMNRGDMPFLGVYDNVRYSPNWVPGLATRPLPNEKSSIAAASRAMEEKYMKNVRLVCWVQAITSC